MATSQPFQEEQTDRPIVSDSIEMVATLNAISTPTESWKPWMAYSTTTGISAGSIGDMGIGKAWSAGYTGIGTKINVNDSGLVNNGASDIEWTRVMSGSFYDTTYITDGHSHGTMVSSVIVGKSNGAGVVGVANQASLYTTNFQDTSSAFPSVTAILNAKVDVSNNSWGWAISSSITGLIRAYTTFSSQVKSLATGGRNGLGINTVFAAGNDNSSGANSSWTSNTNGAFVVTVAAVDVNGQAASFSNRGDANLVSALGVGNVMLDATSFWGCQLFGCQRNEFCGALGVGHDQPDAGSQCQSGLP